MSFSGSIIQGRSVVSTSIGFGSEKLSANGGVVPGLVWLRFKWPIGASNTN
jgi:hypothetical protein